MTKRRPGRREREGIGEVPPEAHAADPTAMPPLRLDEEEATRRASERVTQPYEEVSPHGQEWGASVSLGRERRKPPPKIENAEY